MSTTNIDTTKVNPSLGIKIGKPDAPNTLIEFVNLRCPYCKQWWDEKYQLIANEVSKDNLHYVIKLFDKENPVLAPGNVMHQYVPNDKTAVDVISKIYDTQDDWGHLPTDEDVAHYAENTLGLVKQNNSSILKEIVVETQLANIRFVPTLIVDDIDFDQKISNDEFLALFKK